MFELPEPHRATSPGGSLLKEIKAAHSKKPGENIYQILGVLYFSPTGLQHIPISSPCLPVYVQEQPATFTKS